ncbi:LysR family transcriptional regulator [Bosea psychrotolerans]|uniref:LysR family glycine cleavage system transcriptional activator n=1 Tax=Bosea psychrotolerans TaxID=1871628 RepID=A0A2S4ML91_9HYPH|nr:LysR family transcriptional regulator [Bosea psychrotolerans]POR55554.1 LysR family glycine cleavage system transcriptional activator [Bosea psychrotolerans]
MSHLPSLRALATLEAVVRTGNIVAAADELCVTPGAISKQLGQLQEVIDEPLFEKGHRLRPTPLATELAQAIGAGLLQIRDGWEAASRNGQRRVLTLAANTTLSVHWIMPRLVDVEVAAGGRAIRVSPLHTTDDWQHAQFDIGILRNAWKPEGWQYREIGIERLTLLAPPDRAEALRRTGPAGLEAETVFVADTRGGELESWLAIAGIGKPATIRSTPHFYIAAQAAMAGQGCIIAPPLVLADLIEQGRLAAPFPDIISKGATLTAVFDPSRCKAAFVEKLLGALFRDF